MKIYNYSQNKFVENNGIYFMLGISKRKLEDNEYTKLQQKQRNHPINKLFPKNESENLVYKIDPNKLLPSNINDLFLKWNGNWEIEIINDDQGI